MQYYINAPIVYTETSMMRVMQCSQAKQQNNIIFDKLANIVSSRLNEGCSFLTAILFTNIPSQKYKFMNSPLLIF